MGNVQTMNAHEPARTTPSAWFKSTYSDHGNACVEVRFGSNETLIRDSKYRGDEASRPVIAVPADAWFTFLELVTGIREPQSADRGVPAVVHDTSTGRTTLRGAAGTGLDFTAEEWSAFVAGVIDGEFSRAAFAA